MPGSRKKGKDNSEKNSKASLNKRINIFFEMADNAYDTGDYERSIQYTKNAIAGQREYFGDNLESDRFARANVANSYIILGKRHYRNGDVTQTIECFAIASALAHDDAAIQQRSGRNYTSLAEKIAVTNGYSSHVLECLDLARACNYRYMRLVEANLALDPVTVLDALLSKKRKREEGPPSTASEGVSTSASSVSAPFPQVMRVSEKPKPLVVRTQSSAL